MRHYRRTVVRAHSHGAILVDALLFGSLAGWIYSFAPLLGLVAPIAFTPVSLAALLLLAAFATYPRCCWHFGMHALRGVALGAGASLGTLCGLPPELDFGLRHLSGILQLCATGLLLGMLSSLLSRWVINIAYGAPVIQDGTRCPKCTYPITHLPEKRCPECGNAFGDEDIAPVPRSFGPQWRRTMRQALLVTGLFGILFFTYPYVFVEFLVRFPPPRTAPADWTWTWMAYLNRRPAATALALAACLDRNDAVHRAQATELCLYYRGPNRQLENRLADSARNDPDPLMRQACVGALGSMNAERLADTMHELLADPDPMVRWYAVAALASGGSSPQAIGTPWLIRELNDTDPQVRAYVYRRLCENTGQEFPFDPTASLDQRRQERDTWMAWWQQTHDEP